MPEHIRTPQEIVDQTNGLAHAFYCMHGYSVPADYRFNRARHPQERLCWEMASEAQRRLTDTDPEDALAEIEE